MQVVTLINKGKVISVSIDDLKKMKIELSAQWENLCRNCGKCCFEKMINANNIKVINYDRPCEHLNFIGKKASCGVYEKRFDTCERCTTIPEAIAKRNLPADCPYVTKVAMYKGPVDSGEWFKRVRSSMTKTFGAPAETPTGGTRDAYASPPVREDLVKPKDWKRRRLERIRSRAGGPVGILDPRQKTDYNIKPSGHAGGG
jgi:hypothetical protein